MRDTQILLAAVYHALREGMHDAGAEYAKQKLLDMAAGPNMNRAHGIALRLIANSDSVASVIKAI